MSQIKLHEEQAYVFETARELGYEPKIVSHERPTISCVEKLDLLKENPKFSEWTLDQMIKVLYFTRNHQPFIGLITPELGKNVRQHEIFPRVLGISKTESRKYWVDPKSVPSEMSWGTCTPFPLESSFGTEISDLIVIDHPPIRDKLVDISIGGSTKEMFKTSMHLQYGAIYEILRKTFTDRVHLFTR